MPIFSRRAVLSRFAALAAVQMMRKPSMARALAMKIKEQPPARDVISLSALPAWDKTISTISPEMMGLSYESSQLSAPDFFSSANTELIGLFKKLSPRGVLRLGGNLSEYTQWTPQGASIATDVPFRAVMPDPSSGKTIQPMPLTPTAIRNLRGFLNQTGWHAIYGLKLAHAEPALVVEEAKFVAETLGPRLISFQIGNEPNHYVLNRLRAPGYNFSNYFAEWSRLHSAVVKALPSAKFAGPDIAEDLNWVRQFAAAAPPSVVMLTGHHYAEGPPSDSSVTVEKLLSPDPNFDCHVEKIEAISRSARIPYAMAETNSCYNAGKAGVSDVFASALWAADYTLQLAQASQNGVYFHGGGAGLYTPIAGGSGKPFEPRPIYYGLLLCRDLLGCEMAPVTVTAHSADVSIYALKHPNRIVVINKDASDALINLPANQPAFVVQRLAAPSPESKIGIRLTRQRLDKPLASVQVPKFSAAAITLERGSVAEAV
ncbi:hypothetical protein GCM10011507_32730 [Edaphobacter acidisoli]|uniref:Beta-glucuronidase C-terminal domain-containing protein n=1 Tax=Edaphobacter acidisoli TaxID=2040573 RepID=A0A916S087_9BACT|nr:hypothetical protein [Edaphobacter acidisoli]GGA78928.1 hypothetical protein GCM10011507_32730 [Edaphobacter acidisoli]